MSISPTPARSRSTGSRFAATRWSIVLAAGDRRDSGAARRALGELIQTYWFPLYAYLRRQGSTPTDAEDLVQGFFLRLLEKEDLAAVDRAKGKFRSYLLASLQHFAANERRKARALKRGGNVHLLSLDAQAAEARYIAEPADEMTPQRLFERRWALAVLEQVLASLRREYAGRGQSEVFAALEHVLVGGGKADYASLAGQLGMSEGAIKVAAHRLRRRYRAILREEIAQTVDDPAKVDEEISQLRASL